MRLVDADALYNESMKKEYFSFVEHDNHGRESFAYSCAMQRLAEAPTIDAIPVEWIREKMREPQMREGNPFGFVLAEWLEEQEAR